MKAPNKLQATIKAIRTKPKTRLAVFKNLLPAQQAQICLILSKHLVYDILSRLDDLEVAAILENLDPDEATDILQLFPAAKRPIFWKF
jgi:Mg/Co/Ni transporter MgtE (contains CBS domain)